MYKQYVTIKYIPIRAHATIVFAGFKRNFINKLTSVFTSEFDGDIIIIIIVRH